MSAQITLVKTIGERLKDARDALRLSQAALAKLAGVSPGTIGNIESGQREQPRELLAIAAAAQVSPQWLQSGKGPRTAGASQAPEPAQPAMPPKLSLALAVVLDALQQLPSTRWVSVRAQLDQLAGHPEMRDDVLEELQALLQPQPGKRTGTHE